jgi:hypothetical protein
VDLLERRAGAHSRHPWELARGDFILALARAAGMEARPLRWLDIGSGDGWLAQRLAEQLGPDTTVTCWDANYTAADLVELSDGANGAVRFTAEPPDGEFDVISLFDVLEHVEDDESFLTDVLDRHGGPGVSVLVTVPAHQCVFSHHDVALRHHRRYSPAAARRLLEASGLTVLSEGGLFATLLPVRAGQVVAEKLSRRRPAQDDAVGLGRWERSGWPGAVAQRVLSLDGALSLRLARRGRRMPGLSYWASSRRMNDDG